MSTLKIPVVLTEYQIWEIIKCLEYNQIDNTDGLQVAYEQRLVSKLEKARILAVHINAKTS